ncbi:SDR family oxidoreductase [Methylobrevis albus]|uniref:SDR family oxidoreductase n=1 Tax=Methylobrevis albus TaxID=2793297 RepID=A0A931MZB3_9HYPH|nr:SDR family oxidoreductase [Methylobrevis albus]MBH0238855.1 SDR family oxidoreductase [Methylobrevis albus]
MLRLFIFGAGYSAKAVAARLGGAADWIGGTTRDAEKAAELARLGIEPFVFDGTAPAAALRPALARATHLLVSIAPDSGADPALAQHRADIAAAAELSWIGYFSTVGVYGDHGGGWVDETTPTQPVSRRSKLRVEAEEAWREFADARGLPLSLIRLSGIYGPGRNGFVNLERGRARRLVKPGQVFNRIHVEDIARFTVAALEQRHDGVLNVTDDEPAPPQDVVARAAEIMGVAAPPEQDFDTAELSPMARSFYGENKRVSNAATKRALGLEMAYPTYREALAALWAEGTWRDGAPRSAIGEG